MISIMFKKCLLFLSLFSMLPTFAGEVENALDKGYNVFLYLFSPECKYCTMFTPNYNKILHKHNGQFVFIKADTSTKYGSSLLYEYRGSYVPYVIMINSKKKVAAQIPPYCLMDLKCIESSMEEFRNL